MPKRKTYNNETGKIIYATTPLLKALMTIEMNYGVKKRNAQAKGAELINLGIEVDKNGAALLFKPFHDFPIFKKVKR